MGIKFDKMQGLGNDFVFIDLDYVPPVELTGNSLARICDRCRGIGCDQLILYKCRGSEVMIRIYNQDGTAAEMCGNAARCLGLLMHRRYDLLRCAMIADGKAYDVQVNSNGICVEMGRPSFDPNEIGLSEFGLDPLFLLDRLPLPKELDVHNASCVSLGNPHLVLLCGRLPEESVVISLGSTLESYPLFRHRINVSFACVVRPHKVRLSVFERGAGLTCACGSGACATVAISRVHGAIGTNDVIVEQKGGFIEVSVTEDLNIFQTGPASHVFCGEIEL
ncbi:MAG: diaminopimelate epimerase [Holosporaceae bacterium]|jgi:diaminopimelate epimerase|nr:diaminopimelate epimerase [Holosporaceae bacterium]